MDHPNRVRQRSLQNGCVAWRSGAATGRRTNNSKCPVCLCGFTVVRTDPRSAAAMFIICHRVLQAASRVSCWRMLAGTAAGLRPRRWTPRPNAQKRELGQTDAAYAPDEPPIQPASEQGGFATAVATTFFSPTRSLSICNAGHPTPLLYRIDRRQWAGGRSCRRDLANTRTRLWESSIKRSMCRWNRLLSRRPGVAGQRRTDRGS